MSSEEKSNIIDGIKELTPIALALYTLAMSLYAVGFFWDLPKDIIGAFELTDFIFKASTSFLFAASVLLLPMLLFVIAVFLFDLSPSKKPSEKSDTQSSNSESLYWREMTNQRRISYILIVIAYVLLLFYYNPFKGMRPNISPDGFMGYFIICINFVMLLWPLFGKETRRSIKYISGMFFAFLLPILTGYADAEPDKNAPMIAVLMESCPLIFWTTSLSSPNAVTPLP
jgi:F0F1-type ATP synthase assembly protein I